MSTTQAVSTEPAQAAATLHSAAMSTDPAPPLVTLPDATRPVLLFDGVCNLCAASVHFVLAHEAAPTLLFASLQSDVGRALLAKHNLPPDALETVVLIDGDGAHLRSEAAVRLAARLKWPWNVLAVLRFVPRVLRDIGYRLVASSRYAVFGKSDACLMPTKELKARFL